jgi:hypothetical protein
VLVWRKNRSSAGDYGQTVDFRIAADFRSNVLSPPTVSVLHPLLITLTRDILESCDGREAHEIWLRCQYTAACSAGSGPGGSCAMGDGKRGNRARREGRGGSRGEGRARISLSIRVHSAFSSSPRDVRPLLETRAKEDGFPPRQAVRQADVWSHRAAPSWCSSVVLLAAGSLL